MSGLWVPDWTLHDELGLEHPELVSKDELLELRKAYNSLGAFKEPVTQRVLSVWEPYISAELARAQAELDTQKTDKQLTFTVLGGTSATGKSSMRRSALKSLRERYISLDAITNHIVANQYFERGSVVVDPDNAKLIIPEFQAHLEHKIPGGASFVHEESRQIASSLLDQAVSTSMPIVYDTSGQFNDGFQTLKDAKNAGYRVPAIYFIGDIDTLVARAKDRGLKTGRDVPSGIIPTMQNNVIRLIPQLWQSGLLDSLIVIDSTDINNMKLILELHGQVDPTSRSGAMLTVGNIWTPSSFNKFFQNQWW